MTEYDDEPPSPTRGWARPPSPHPGGRSADDYSAYEAAPTSPPAGRASVGRASVGRASVSPSDGYRPADPYRRDPTPSGDLGTGSYADSYVDATGGTPAGGGPAELGSGQVLGRAVVGRASVRPAGSVGSAEVGRARVPGSIPVGPNGPEELDVLGPEEPAGGAVRRPARAGAKKKRKGRKRNIVIAAFALFIMLVGGGLVAFTYYFDTIPLPEDLSLPEASTFYYSNNVNPIAKLGEYNRSIIDVSKLPKHVRFAAIAAEDRNFYTHDGIDVAGIMRAAWNNFTGGATEGASTITQQYAREAADLNGVTYARKLREAVIAWKLDREYSKDKILDFYLNTIYFGRDAYGIEAAAQVYFKKRAEQLSVSEAMVLAGVIKSPGAGTFDPAVNPERAKDRWEYIKRGMIEIGELAQADADKLVYPKTQPYDPDKPTATKFGMDKPTGLVVYHALSELRQTKEFKNKSWQEIKDGGYRIITSIDQQKQGILEALANERVKGSVMNGQPDKLRAAGAAVDPKTGRVLAYYGNSSGSGGDFAGWYIDEKGNPAGYGKHPPGSSFKVYVLAEALRTGIRLDSYWESRSKMKFEGRDKEVVNASTCSSRYGSAGKCSLLGSTVHSLNTPYFAVTIKVGAANALEMARRAGVNTMWTDADERVELNRIKSTEEVVPKKFNNELGIGQYGVTPLEHAAGMATFANYGHRQNTHFVIKVMKGKKTEYTERLRTPADPNQNDLGMTRAQMDNLWYAMSQVTKSSKFDGRDVMTKTGTWQYRDTKDNAHAWVVGFTEDIAMAVWVGNEGDEKPIKNKSGGDVYGSGLPTDILAGFIKKALKDVEKKDIEKPDFTGDYSLGGDPPPQDTGQTGQPIIPGGQPGFPGGQNDGGNGNGNNNGGNGNNGNGNNGNGNGNNNGGNNGNNGLPGLSTVVPSVPAIPSPRE